MLAGGCGVLNRLVQLMLVMRGSWISMMQRVLHCGAADGDVRRWLLDGGRCLNRDPTPGLCPMVVNLSP